MARHRRTALLSAYDKIGLKDFAAKLASLKWHLMGSAGTAKYLCERGILCRDVAEFIGPPILGHRVVTLSREIHAALMAQDTPEDKKELDNIGVPRIDLVYVNLYPLEAETLRSEATLESIIEKTDIGGPTLIRSAAKGRRLVICRQQDMADALEYASAMAKFNTGCDPRVISFFAAIAEQEVSAYCAISADFHRKYAQLQ
mgnify:FL=1